MPTVSRPTRAVAAVILVLGGASLAQLPDVGSSSSEAPTTAAPAPPPQTPEQPASPTPAAPPSAPGPTTPTLVVSGDATRTATFVEMRDAPRSAGAADAQVARLPLVVSGSPELEGSLRVRFKAERDGETVSLTRGLQDISKQHPVLFTDSNGPLRLRPSQPTVLPLRIALPADAEPSLANGVIVISVHGQAAQVASVTVTGVAPDATFVPQTLKLRVTRWAGPFDNNDWLAGESVDVQVLGPGAQALAATAEPIPVRIHSGSNGVLEGELNFDRTPGPNQALAEATFEVTEAQMTDKYTGSVAVDPRDKPTATLPIEVEVQDAFIWPLAVLLVSATLGALAITRQNRNRSRAVIKNSLVKAAEQYRRDHTRAKGMFEIDPDLLAPSEPVPPKCPKGESLGADASRMAQTYCRVDRTNTDAELAALASEAKKLVESFDAWARVAHQWLALNDELARLRLPASDPAAKDTETLLELGRYRGPTLEAQEKLAEAMRLQRLLLPAYDRLRQAWAELEPKQKELLKASDPATVYTPGATSRDAAAVSELQKKLAIANEVVEKAPSEDEATDQLARGIDAEVTLRLEDILSGVTYSVRGEDDDLITRRRKAIAETAQTRSDATPERKVSGPESALDQIRHWDFIIASAVVLLSAIAFLLPKYTESHTWGSWDDYLQLAVVGFLGSLVTGGLVLSWERFPGLRSYELSSLPPAGGPPPPAPGAAASGSERAAAAGQGGAAAGNKPPGGDAPAGTGEPPGGHKDPPAGGDGPPARLA